MNLFFPSVSLIGLFFNALSFASSSHDPMNLDRLKEIVNINSGSANIQGVLKVQETLRPWFEELGFKVNFLPNPEGETVSAPMLIATLAGEKPEAITLLMHADTVFEPSSPFQKGEQLDEFRLKGPGVIDDKGGVIVALHALRDYFQILKTKNQKSKYTLQVVVTPNEEVGAIGWWKTFEEMSKKSAFVLGLEPSYQQGIIQGRKGNIWYEVEVQGKESHAGAHHEKGINACAILSKKISEISALTDYKKNITVSVGRMEGGQDKFNIVCGWAKAKIDTRVPDLDSRKKLHSQVESILKDPHIRFRIVDETAPLGTNKKSIPYIEKYLKIIEKIEGKKPQSRLTGGVGDVNHFAREGVVILDGLGPVGDSMHTPDEFIDLRSIPTRAKALTEFLIQI